MVGQRVALLLATALLGSGPALSGSDPVFVSTALAAPAPAAPHVVKIDSFAFKPPVITVKVGDTVEWPVPKGVRRFQILRVLFQPEAAERAVIS